MKNLISLIFLIPVISFAQVKVDIGAGYNFSCSHAVVKLSVGYEVKKIVIEAVEQPTVTHDAGNPNYFGLKAGYNIHGVIPMVGYMYNYTSADDKSKNKGAVGYSLKYVYTLGDPGGLFVEGLYVHKVVEIVFGFHINF